MDAQLSLSSPPGSAWKRLVTLLLATAVLYLITLLLPEANCVVVFALAALIAWPVWQHRAEARRFQRRALLLRATHEQGWVRRRLWAGSFLLLAQFPVALFAAFVLLVAASHLSFSLWLVLGADALLLALAYGWVCRWLATQVRQEHLGLFARLWPLGLANLLLVAVGFAAVNFLVGVPDTRAMDWHVVVSQAVERAEGTLIGCPVTQILAGVWFALNDLAWHINQQVIPNLPGSGWKVMAWTMFLGQAGLLAWSWNCFMLGCISLLEACKLRVAAIVGDTTLTRTFIAMIVVLSVPYFYAGWKLQNLDPQAFLSETERTLAAIDPCKPDAQTQQTLSAGLNEDIEAGRQQARQHVERQVAKDVERSFAAVEAAVDNYLDWYFTILGEYARLTAVVTNRFPEKMSEELERHLFVETGFEEQLQDAAAALAESSEVSLSQLGQKVGLKADFKVRAEPCRLKQTDLSGFGDIDRDKLRAASAAMSGGAVGAVAAGLMAKKAMGAVVTKVAAKKSITAAAALATKAAGKKGASFLTGFLGGSVICTPSGPAAIACGLVLGAAAWVSVDKIFLEVDEVLFRDEMRQDIIAVLEEEKAALVAVLQADQLVAVDAMAGQLQRATEKMFVPVDDGI